MLSSKLMQQFRAVFENTYFTFFFQNSKHTFFMFSGNDVSKKRRKRCQSFRMITLLTF